MADERKKRMSGRRRNVDRNNRRKLEGGGYVRVYTGEAKICEEARGGNDRKRRMYIYRKRDFKY